MENNDGKTPLEQLKLALQMMEDQYELSVSMYEQKYYPESHPRIPYLLIKQAVLKLESIEEKKALTAVGRYPVGMNTSFGKSNTSV